VNGSTTRIDCAAGAVCVRRSGRLGERPVFLLHNGGADSRIWDAQVGALAADHDVAAIDLPGFGESDKPDVPYDLDLYVRTLDEVVATLGAKRPILIGNCIGAATALEYATIHPGAVRALVLFNVCGGRVMLRRSVGFDANPAAWRRRPFLATAWIVGRVPFLHRRVVDTLFGGPRRGLPIHGELAAIQRTGWHRRSRWNLIRGLESFNKYGRPYARPDGLPPALLAWGAANRVLSPACGRELAKGLRPERFVEIDGAGHLPMVEEPERVNAMIREFLRGID
jgi:pimeloyl-ACP methyl ester carboxylesterase